MWPDGTSQLRSMHPYRQVCPRSQAGHAGRRRVGNQEYRAARAPAERAQHVRMQRRVRAGRAEVQEAVVRRRQPGAWPGRGARLATPRVTSIRPGSVGGRSGAPAERGGGGAAARRRAARAQQVVEAVEPVVAEPGRRGERLRAGYRVRVTINVPAAPGARACGPPTPCAPARLSHLRGLDTDRQCLQRWLRGRHPVTGAMRPDCPRSADREPPDDPPDDTLHACCDRLRTADTVWPARQGGGLGASRVKRQVAGGLALTHTWVCAPEPRRAWQAGNSAAKCQSLTYSAPCSWPAARRRHHAAYSCRLSSRRSPQPQSQPLIARIAAASASRKTERRTLQLTQGQQGVAC